MLEQITDRIWYLPHNSDTDRPCLGYVRGDRRSLMIDAGASPGHVALFLSELDREALPHPQLVAITHWHWDHTFGLIALDAIAIACGLTDERLRTMATWEWNDAAVNERLQSGEEVPFCAEMMRREYDGELGRIRVRPADVLFDEHIVVALGGVSCELLRVGGPHADDSVICFVPEEKALFLGDFSGEALHPEPKSVYRDKLREGIAMLRAIDFAVAVEGHWTHESKAETIRELEDEVDGAA